MSHDPQTTKTYWAGFIEARGGLRLYNGPGQFVYHTRKEARKSFECVKKVKIVEVTRGYKMTPRALTKYNLAIVGPYNTIWTSELFETREKAYERLNKFWGKGKWQPEKWHVIEAVLTIEPVKGASLCPIKQ